MICEETKCKNCHNYKNCELRLPYDKYLVKAQNRIKNILINLQFIEEDIDYYWKIKIDIKKGKYGTINDVKQVVNIDYDNCKSRKKELISELRELRQFEQNRINILRRRLSEK